MLSQAEQLRTVTIGDFHDFVRDRAFPAALQSLQTLVQPEDVRLWRKQLVRDLAEVLVTGESPKDAIEADVDPQDFEESKEDISFARRIYFEANRIQDELRLREKEFASQILML